MGSKVKIQKGQRPTNRAFKVVMPTAIAEAVKMEKGEDFEWLIEDKNTLILARCNELQPFAGITLSQNSSLNVASENYIIERILSNE